MNGDPGDMDINDGPEGEDEQGMEWDDFLAQMEDADVDEEEAALDAQFRQEEAALDQAVQALMDVLFAPVVLPMAQAEVHDDPMEDVGQDRGGVAETLSDVATGGAAPAPEENKTPTLRQAREAVSAVLKHNGSTDGSDDGSGPRGPRWNANLWLLLMLPGVRVTRALGAVFDEVARVTTGQDDSDIPLPAPVKDNIRNIASGWMALDDGTFWARMGVLAKAADLKAADLVYFMQYAAVFFPLKQPLLWKSAEDKMAVVTEIRAAYARRKSVQDALGILASLTYLGRPLERYAQASCACLAFALEIVAGKPQ